jgi:hypothetical protein
MSASSAFSVWCSVCAIFNDVISAVALKWGEVSPALSTPMAVLSLLVAVCALLATMRQANGPDHVFLVADLSQSRLPFEVSPAKLRADVGEAEGLKVVLENAGAGPALMVDVRAEIIIPKRLEPIVDALDPVGFGPKGAVRLGFTGSPGSVTIGLLQGKVLALGCQTYALAMDHRQNLTMLPAVGRLEISLPFALTRALAIYAVVAPTRFGRSQARLRVSVDSVNRRGKSVKTLFFFDFEGGLIRRDGDQFTYSFEVLRKRASALIAFPKRAKYAADQRRRQLRYLRRDASKRFWRPITFDRVF